MESNLNNILALLKTSFGVYNDDHHRSEKNTGIAKAIAVHGDHVVLLCPDAKYFSINRLYINNGQVHLSTMSVGGVIDLRKVNSLEEAVRVYNEQEMIFPRPKLTDVTYLPYVPVEALEEVVERPIAHTALGAKHHLKVDNDGLAETLDN